MASMSAGSLKCHRIANNGLSYVSNKQIGEGLQITQIADHVTTLTGSLESKLGLELRRYLPTEALVESDGISRLVEGSRNKMAKST